LDLGLPGLFVSVPAERADSILSELRNVEVAQAAATVFGHDINASGNWCINTAEI
jgi:hypothetical protein